MSAATADKYLVFVSTQCIDSGEIGSGPFSALFDSQDQGVACFAEQVATNRISIEREITKIADPANGLVFESPYTLQAALFAIPSDAADSAEDAIEWISEQLANDEDISDNVLQFEGTSFGPHGEKAVTLDEFFSCW
jgi:hypothetical protein